VYEQFNELSQGEKELSFLNNYFIFKKVRAIADPYDAASILFKIHFSKDDVKEISVDEVKINNNNTDETDEAAKNSDDEYVDADDEDVDPEGVETPKENVLKKLTVKVKRKKAQTEPTQNEQKEVSPVVMKIVKKKKKKVIK
jgi:hypothetical protein